MGKKIIFHVDVNSAFLSWSAVKQLKENPSAQDLRKIPSIVGGDRATRHGIVTAKSIPAKKFHIQTGEPVAKALQKCPSLVIVSSDFSTYREYSKAFINILYRYTNRVQQASIDEAYMDVTGLYEKFRAWETVDVPYPICLATQIKDTIYKELGFTVNVGISDNKLLAKMASDFEKPDRVHTLYPEEIPEKMWPLPIQALYGCGKKTAQRLNRLGIRTIGDAAEMPINILQSHLGNKAGEYIYNSANGWGSDELALEEREAKSYSNETTTSYDITRENYEQEMPPKLKYLSDKVSVRMQRDGCFANTISVIVKTDDFQKHSMQMKLPNSVNDGRVIYDTAKKLMDELLLGKNHVPINEKITSYESYSKLLRNFPMDKNHVPINEKMLSENNIEKENNYENGLLRDGVGIRLVGVRASGLDDGSFHQMTLFEMTQNEHGESIPVSGQVSEQERHREQQQKLEEMVETLQKKFGENAVGRGAAGIKDSYKKFS